MANAFLFPEVTMGKHNSKLAPEMLDDLVRSTEFNEQELKQWYKGFLKDCPTGILNLEEFQQLYIKVWCGVGRAAELGQLVSTNALLMYECQSSWSSHKAWEACLSHFKKCVGCVL